MKPLIVIEIAYYDPDNAKAFDEYLHRETGENGSLKGYEVLVIYGDVKARVYYPCKPISYYYHKLRIWLLRKLLFYEKV